jgi:hypothetical protein
MDGWMDGWVDGLMDGWVGGWIDGWVDGWMDGWMDGWVNGLMDGYTNSWKICCLHPHDSRSLRSTQYHFHNSLSWSLPWAYFFNLTPKLPT